MSNFDLRPRVWWLPFVIIPPLIGVALVPIPYGWTWAAVVAVLALLAFAVVVVADWWAGRRAWERLIEQNHDPRIEALRLFKELPPETQANLVVGQILREVIPNLDGPVIRFRFPTQPPERAYYTGEDVKAVWHEADDYGPAVVRTWADGSIRRELAAVMIADFVSLGWAVDASGNRPARWTEDGKELAYRSLWGKA
jgi:hypothetical protein